MLNKLFISMLLAISLVSCGGKYKVVIQKEGEEKKTEAAATTQAAAPAAPAVQEVKTSYQQELLAKMRPFDKNVKADLKSGVDMSGTASRSLEGWDAELNKVYKLLKGKLSSSEQEQLKIEQRQWIKERDRKAEEDSAELGGTDGAMVYNMSLSEETRNRTLELAKMYDEK